MTNTPTYGINKNETTYEANHSNPNGVNLALSWLQEQRVIQKIEPKTKWAIKQVVEGLSGEYVSRDDVIVAAHFLGLKGTYDTGYNISYKGIKEYYTPQKR